MKAWYYLTLAMLMGLGGAAAQAADDDEDAALEALQKVQSLVGAWEGSGSSPTSKGWDESVDCTWKFGKGGKMSLALTFKNKDESADEGRLLDEARLVFDPERKKYVFRAYSPKSDEVLVFEGVAKTDQNLVLDRVDKNDAGDKLDRLDVKILVDGDRLVYTFQQRVGKSKVYRPYAMVSLNRHGASLAGGGNTGPKCVVTGGAGIMSVEYKGKSYPVCCTGCREVFLSDPEKFIAKLDK